jgi:hypothetical protein
MSKYSLTCWLHMVCRPCLIGATVQYAACSCSMDIQHGQAATHAAFICSMDLQQEYGHAA